MNEDSIRLVIGFSFAYVMEFILIKHALRPVSWLRIVELLMVISIQFTLGFTMIASSGYVGNDTLLLRVLAVAAVVVTTLWIIILIGVNLQAVRRE